MGERPLSVYVHIPFCVHKCSYCDFFSIGMGEREIPGAAYMRSATTELTTMVERLGLAGRPVGSIFFGGGTPSMVEPRLLSDFLARASALLTTAKDLEVTCEANPETIDQPRLEGLRAAGINRLSMGVQSFHAHHLRFMERIHSAESSRCAVRDAQRAGFENMNLDLIFGLPHETDDELAQDLAEITALEPQHIAAYQLTIEPKTPLAQQVARSEVTMPSDDVAITMWHQVRNTLREAGYAAYEVSNYARPGYQCRHNAHYWRSGEYLGIGTGAVSRIGSHRWRRKRALHPYLAGELHLDEEELLDPSASRLEAVWLALRTTEGLSLEDFERDFGITFDEQYPGLRARWYQEGLAQKGSSLHLTARGLAILDHLATDL